jgi:hypothetical protein
MVEAMGRQLWLAMIEKGYADRSKAWPHCPEVEWCRSTALTILTDMQTPSFAVIEAKIDRGASNENIWRALVAAILADGAPDGSKAQGPAGR